MPIDPNIPLQAKGVQLESPMNQLGMMNEAMKYNEMNRSIDTQNKLRDLYSQGIDIGTPEGFKQVAAIDPATALKLRTDALQGQKLQGEIKKTGLEVTAKDMEIQREKLGNLAFNPSDSNIKAHLEDSVLEGKLTPQAAQQQWQQVANLPLAQRTQHFNDMSVSSQERYKMQETMRHNKTTEGIAGGHLKLAQERLKQEIATEKLTPETTDLLAQTYIKTGTLPPLGMGKAAAGMRQTILNRAAQISMGGVANPDGTVKPSVSAEDAASNIVQNKSSLIGNRASERTLGTNLANIVAAGSEAEKMISIAENYATKINPTDFPIINAAGNYVAKNSGDPVQAGLATSLNSLVNAYARAINPKGVATVSDKTHAREVIEAKMSSGQFKEVFNVMRQEMQAAQAAPEEARAKIRGTSGKEKSNLPAGVGADWVLKTDANGNKAYVSPDNSKFVEIK
jgi:hypothetical protein